MPEDTCCLKPFHTPALTSRPDDSWGDSPSPFSPFYPQYFFWGRGGIRRRCHATSTKVDRNRTRLKRNRRIDWWNGCVGRDGQYIFYHKFRRRDNRSFPRKDVHVACAAFNPAFILHLRINCTRQSLTSIRFILTFFYQLKKTNFRRVSTAKLSLISSNKLYECTHVKIRSWNCDSTSRKYNCTCKNKMRLISKKKKKFLVISSTEYFFMNVLEIPSASEKCFWNILIISDDILRMLLERSPFTERISGEYSHFTSLGLMETGSECKGLTMFVLETRDRRHFLTWMIVIAPTPATGQ